MGLTVVQLPAAIAKERARAATLAPRTRALYGHMLDRLEAELAVAETNDGAVVAMNALQRIPRTQWAIASGIFHRMGIDIAVAKQVETMPHPLTSEMWLRVVRAFEARTPKTFQDWRARAMMLTLATSSLRPGDLLSVQISDYRPPTLRLRQKGNRPREIELHPIAVAAIDDYIPHRDRLGSDLPALWLGLDPITATVSAMTYEALRYQHNEQLRRMRIPHFEMRQLRSTVATLLSDQGAAIVAAALGHRSLQTSVRYVDPTRRQSEAMGHLSKLLEGNDAPPHAKA
jgi:integrase